MNRQGIGNTMYDTSVSEKLYSPGRVCYCGVSIFLEGEHQCQKQRLKKYLLSFAPRST